MDTIKRWMKNGASFLEDSILLSSLRQGVVLAIPFLMAGSIALVLNSFPVSGYQAFLDGFLGGRVRDLLVLIYNSTLNALSLLLLVTISYNYGRNRDGERAVLYPLVALCSYVACVYKGEETAPLEIFSPPWLFTAIVVALGSSALFRCLVKLKPLRNRQYTEGADVLFNRAITAIWPAVLIVALFAALNVLLSEILGTTALHNVASDLFMTLFEQVGRNFGGALLFILSIHLLWFFGVHGSNVLDGVARQFFENGIEVNRQLIEQGSAPTEIYSKTFFDTFVLMGGCGTALCLVIAMLIVCRSKSNRRLAKIGAFPVLFNVSELMVFGLPVVLNPVMLLPFLLTPLVLTGISGLACAAGLVPVAVNPVEWTTPALVSGYVATGSLAGSALQLVNIVVGVGIYLPFVRLAERRQAHQVDESIHALTDLVKRGEEGGSLPSLLTLPGRLGTTAKMLASDLHYAARHGGIELYYQPQMKADGTPFGGEALLRWKHPSAGFLYPPLVIALAREDHFLDELGLLLIEQACRDFKRLEEACPVPLDISVNITPDQLNRPDFTGEVQKRLRAYRIPKGRLGFEITEQVALSSSTAVHQRLLELREMGLQVIMDDFGMGHGSMAYLQNAEFSIVKLDGSLVRPILANERSENIVRSIQQLADSLGFCLLAEFVETPEQRDRLAQLGCTLYQGYLYSPALPLDGFITYIQRMGVRPDALAGESGSVLPSSDDGGCRELVRYPAGSGDDDCV